MKNPICHIIICLVPFVVFMCLLNKDMLGGMACIIYLLLWAAVYVPAMDYRRLKFLNIMEPVNIGIKQKIYYAYSCRFKFPRKMLFAAGMAAVMFLSAACDKKDDDSSYESTGRIASYYGVARGEGVFRVLNVCSGGEWIHWPAVSGLDYEEGYEYEVKVRIDRRRDLEGMMDVMFGYDVTCLEVVRKVKKQTDDCPLQSWDEFIAEHPEWVWRDE